MLKYNKYVSSTPERRHQANTSGLYLLPFPTTCSCCAGHWWCSGQRRRRISWGHHQEHRQASQNKLQRDDTGLLGHSWSRSNRSVDAAVSHLLHLSACCGMVLPFVLCLTLVLRRRTARWSWFVNIFFSLLLYLAVDDYTPQTMTSVLLTANVPTTTVTILIIDDTIAEPTERFELAMVETQIRSTRLLKPVGVVSILDDEIGKRPTSCHYFMWLLYCCWIYCPH